MDSRFPLITLREMPKADVIVADPGARLVIDLKPGTTPEQMAEAIESTTLGPFTI
jgi:hypothetical protein